jgi:hypothetical protein
MSDQEDSSRVSEPPPPEPDEADQAEIRELIRGAVSQREPPAVDVLHAVQRRIRQDTNGRYYADGWSTTRQPPIATYLVTSLVMLAIVIFVYFMLSPLTDAATTVEPPAPVHVIPMP